jgi:phage terminase large subunit-like protein
MTIGRPRKHFADAAEEYATKVLRGEIMAGPYVRKACERHFRDIAEQKQRGLLWDWSKAADVIRFFESCLHHGDGDKDKTLGKPFKLLLWQKFIIGQLYAWRWKDGSRRFRTAYIEIGKGAGKSPMIAGLALNEMTDPGIGAAEIFS